MSTEEPVSAFINVTMTVPGPVTLYMPGSDSNFGSSIKNDLVESFVFFIVQISHSTVSEFI